VSELQQSRYDKILRRVGDLKGPGSKVADVVTELFPMLDVENVPGELLALGGTALCFGGQTLGPQAALIGRIQLFNPVGSGKLITVTQMVTASNVTEGWRAGMVNVALATAPSTQIHRDPRLGLTTLPVGQIRTALTAAAAPGTLQWRVLASTSFTMKDPNGVAILTPGTGFETSIAIVNTRVEAFFFWRERVAEPSELNI